MPINAERSRKKLTSLKVNGRVYEKALSPISTLLEILREDLGLTGTKHGCELGECGACAVLLNDVPVLSCLTLAVECEGKEITTIEGLADGNRLHPLQTAFAELGAAQCGYCTSGILCVAKSLLDKAAQEKKSNPGRELSRAEIKEALSGNICRCTGYLKIIEAIELTAERLNLFHRCEPVREDR
jgi:carbon-monoxide dehydrogenase small subunit